MLFYSAELAVGTELPKPFTDYIDDPLQMAGNVISNQRGEMVFVYACQYPSDRPSVTEMIDVLRNLESKRE
ncbi:hypothetical protein GHT06_013746 [Daphnia sinensis]|uniref:Uncharacterized protein n=1 Tax=Daphnia sinensis TaxID=1820382 RepID=A0AAD5PTT7_9CRUS|nr:hypothetical protein GHT06_013746 [Daphnia sinensis]